jgi:hypothetical protein
MAFLRNALVLYDYGDFVDGLSNDRRAVRAAACARKLRAEAARRRQQHRCRIQGAPPAVADASLAADGRGEQGRARGQGSPPVAVHPRRRARPRRRHRRAPRRALLLRVQPRARALLVRSRFRVRPVFFHIRTADCTDHVIIYNFNETLGILHPLVTGWKGRGAAANQQRPRARADVNATLTSKRRQAV